MILITDGVNNAGQIDPISAAKLAKKKNIKVIRLVLEIKMELLFLFIIQHMVSVMHVIQMASRF